MLRQQPLQGRVAVVPGDWNSLLLHPLAATAGSCADAAVTSTSTTAARTRVVAATVVVVVGSFAVVVGFAVDSIGHLMDIRFASWGMDWGKREGRGGRIKFLSSSI